MTLPVVGAGGTLGIGIESTWGTAVARTNWLRMVSMGLRRMPTFQSEPHLGSLGTASTMHRFPYQESDFAGGPLSWVAAYDDSTVLMMQHMLGAVATTGPVSTAYTHLCTLASPVPIGLTLEQISGKGNAGSTLNTNEVFEGCKLVGGKISLTAGGLLMVETDVIAQTSGGETTNGTPSYSAGGNMIKHNQCSGVSLGGNARAIQSFTINIERDLQRRHEIGSLFTSEPHEESLMVTAELRTKWQTDAFYTALLAGTQADLTIPFTGSGDNALTITLHNVQLQDLTKDSGSRGSIDQVIKLRAFADASDQGCALSFVNANATAATN